MARPILVDSSIYIGLARRGIHPITELSSRAGELDWATCGMVRMEVERGVRQPKSKEEFQSFFDVLINAPTTNKVWESAAELAWTLDRRGVTLPAQDILIACCARSLDASVLTFDRHFEQIHGLEVFSRLEELE